MSPSWDIKQTKGPKKQRFILFYKIIGLLNCISWCCCSSRFLGEIVLPSIKEREQVELSVTLQKGRKWLRKIHFLAEKSGAYVDLYDFILYTQAGKNMTLVMRRWSRQWQRRGKRGWSCRGENLVLQAGCNRWKEESRVIFWVGALRTEDIPIKW